MKAEPLIVYIPDRRDVIISSRYTAGNNKLGYDVFTYSRLAGREHMVEIAGPQGEHRANLGTCPGSTDECEAICYAKRIGGAVKDIYVTNSETWDVPPIPEACRLLRIHVSGDFDCPEYISNWTVALKLRPDVTAWAYTRSWRVPELLPALERLRALPNMQLFASMDSSHDDLPPHGWRRAWLEGDSRLTPHSRYSAASFGHSLSRENQICQIEGTPSYICPEETGRKANCVSCGYCFEGQRNDVTFLRH